MENPPAAMGSIFSTTSGRTFQPSLKIKKFTIRSFPSFFHVFPQQ